MTGTIADPSPFLLTGGPVAMLLIHGFTGSPSEMRLLGHYLHERGLTVAAPLLPGHGTREEDLNQKRWTDWVDSVTQAYADLQRRCEVIFVGGESLGSLLALHLAQQQQQLDGAILLSPPIIVTDPRRYVVPLLKYLVPKAPKSEEVFVDPTAIPRLWAYEQLPSFAAHEVLKLIHHVKRGLPQVTCPLLILQSTQDRTIHSNCARYIGQKVSSTDKQIVFLHDSGHVLALDREWRIVAETVHHFICTHLPDRLHTLI